MVRVERQASGSLRCFRTHASFGANHSYYYYVILAVASCCFGVCWGYWIGSCSNQPPPPPPHPSAEVGHAQQLPPTSQQQLRSLLRGGDTTNSAATADAENNGWSTIQVYYGDQSLLTAAAPGGWYSQVQQDQVVAALLRNKRDGYFVDLASNDAVSLSNTFALEQRLNWNGLCIEPNPTYWLDLTARKCNLVGAVVGQKRMEKVSFTLSRKEFGGIIGAKFDQTSVRKGMHPRDFFTVPLFEIFVRNNVPRYIDYLSLDIEGAELYVMEAFPFDQYTVRIITIERPKRALRELLEKNGYKLLRILSDFGETLWIHESATNGLDVQSLDSFALPNQQVGLKNLEEMNYVYLKKNKLNQST